MTVHELLGAIQYCDPRMQVHLSVMNASHTSCRKGELCDIQVLNHDKDEVTLELVGVEGVDTGE